MLNPKDSYENMLSEFQILEHTDDDVHHNHETVETDETLLKAEHIHNKHVANQKIAVAGTQVGHEINDESNAENNAVPPPPSFSESDHRMSAMLFHVPPPPIEAEASDEIVNFPPPALPPMKEAVDLPPPPAPPGL